MKTRSKTVIIKAKYKLRAVEYRTKIITIRTISHAAMLTGSVFTRST